MSSSGDWTGYYDGQGEREPRDLLLQVLRSFEAEGRVGRGRRPRVRAGIRDGRAARAADGRSSRSTRTEEGIRRLRRADPGRARRPSAHVVSPMQEPRVPRADLVYASFSLPFCPPAAFPRSVGADPCGAPPGRALRRGAVRRSRHVGLDDPDMTFHDVSAARALFDGLELESFVEEEEDGEAFDGTEALARVPRDRATSAAMRVVLQRVRRASVMVDGERVAEIGRGYLLLVGVGTGDSPRGARPARGEDREPAAVRRRRGQDEPFPARTSTARSSWSRSSPSTRTCGRDGGPSWGRGGGAGGRGRTGRGARRGAGGPRGARGARGVRRDDGRRAAERRAVHAGDRRLVAQLDVGRPDRRLGSTEHACSPSRLAERVPVASHPSVEAVGRPGERLGQERDGGSGGQEPSQRGRRRAARVPPPVGRDEVPRREPVRHGQVGEQPSPSSLWIGAARRRPRRSQRSSRSSDQRQKPQSSS